MNAVNEFARVIDIDSGELVVCVHACDCCPENDHIDTSGVTAASDDKGDE